MNPVRCPLAVSRFESSSWGFALNSSSERKLRPSPKAPALVSGSTGVDLDFEMLLRADLADLADALFDDPVCTGLSRLRELMATYACTTSRPLFRPAALGTSFFFTSHHTEQEKIRKSSSSPSNVGSYFFKKRTTERDRPVPTRVVQVSFSIYIRSRSQVVVLHAAVRLKSAFFRRAECQQTNAAQSSRPTHWVFRLRLQLL